MSLKVQSLIVIRSQTVAGGNRDGELCELARSLQISSAVAALACRGHPVRTDQWQSTDDIDEPAREVFELVENPNTRSMHDWCLEGMLKSLNFPELVIASDTTACLLSGRCSISRPYDAWGRVLAP